MNYRYNNNPFDSLDLRNEAFGVTRTNGAELTIPNAPGNRDWQDFKQWEAAGNSAADAPLVSLDEYKLEAAAIVNNESNRRRLDYTTRGKADLSEGQRTEVDRYEAKKDRGIRRDDFPLMSGHVADGQYSTIEAAYNDWNTRITADNAYIETLDRYTRAQLSAIDAATTHEAVRAVLDGLNWPTAARR